MCRACPAGQHSPGGGAECFSCPDGRATNDQQTACTLCPAGRYSHSTSGPGCQSCSAGRIAAQPGASGCTSTWTEHAWPAQAPTRPCSASLVRALPGGGGRSHDRCMLLPWCCAADANRIMLCMLRSLRGGSHCRSSRARRVCCMRIWSVLQRGPHIVHRL